MTQRDLTSIPGPCVSLLEGEDIPQPSSCLTQAAAPLTLRSEMGKWNLKLSEAPDRPLPREVSLAKTRRNGDQPSAGRQTQLTDAVAETICTAIANGNYFHVAAGVANVSHQTLREWIRRGVGDSDDGLDTVYARFAEAIARAEKDHESRLVATLSDGGEGKYKDWRAQAFVLERRHKERWGAPGQQAPAIQLTLSNDQAASLLECLRLAAAKDVTPSKD